MMTSEIVVENYTNDEKVIHPLVLIKGRVVNFLQSITEIELILSNNTIQRFNISRKGHFKVLLELNLGKNCIKLQYHDTIKVLKLHLVEASNHNCKKIQPIYLLCRDTQIPDETFAKNCKKLMLGCKIAQCLYSEKLNEGTGCRKTFLLSNTCTVFQLDITETQAHQLSDQQLWELTGRQLIESHRWNISTTKFIAFTSFTKYLGLAHNTEYSYAQIKRQTLSNPALSSGGLALLGTGCLYTWPCDVSQIISCFIDKTQVDITHELDDSNYRCTYGGCFSTTIGSVCHELGHIFDLGHTTNGIMGKDIDYIGRVFVTELHTENLPDRIVGTNIKKSPKFTKFTRINRNPGQYLVKYHEQKDDDLTFFTQNNLVTLVFHQWFNQGEEMTEKSDIRYCEELNLVKSQKSQLAMIELRRVTDEMTVNFWNFTEKEIYEFRIPEENIPDVVLFAINFNGDTLKQNLKL